MSQNIFSDGLGYEGKVTLTLKSGTRVLESKTYKNNGTVKLFKFLCYCLADSYEEAKNLLPAKILLLKNGSGQTRPNTLAHAKADLSRRSGWQSWSQLPTIVNAEDSVKVVYSFEVPRNSITGPFDQVALYGYGMTATSDISDFSAYHYLTDNSGNLSAIDITGWSATTVLLIEWELSLSNKNVGTNTD